MPHLALLYVIFIDIYGITRDEIFLKLERLRRRGAEKTLSLVNSVVGVINKNKTLCLRGEIF